MSKSYGVPKASLRPTKANFAKMQDRTPIFLAELHSSQEDVKKQASRFNVVVCGRRWGKTHLGQDIACVAAAQDRKRVGWFAPNYKYLAETFRWIRMRLESVVISANASEYRIELMGGGTIEFWTLENPDAGRSRMYDVVIIDEAGLVLELADRWREAIRATLLDRSGVAWFLGTPKPPRSIQLKNYAFYQFYLRGLTGEDDWQSFHLPSGTNPYLRKCEIAAMRKEPGMTKRIARQEIDADFLSEATGAIWTMGLIAPYRCPRPSSVEAVKTVLFIDPGNFSPSETADPTGIVIATAGDNGHFYVEADLSGIYTPNRLARVVVQAAEEYGARVYFESNQGGEYVRSAIRNVAPIPVVGVPSTKGKEHRAMAPLSCYEMGHVHHAVEFIDLENEMVNWNPYDKKMPSPNRMDALVGALNVLMGSQSTGTRTKDRIWRA